MAIKKSNAKANDEIKMEVLEKCGVISEGANGWTTELRYVAWNGNAAKYDLRSWKMTAQKSAVKELHLPASSLKNSER